MDVFIPSVISIGNVVIVKTSNLSFNPGFSKATNTLLINDPRAIMVAFALKVVSSVLKPGLQVCAGGEGLLLPNLKYAGRFSSKIRGNIFSTSLLNAGIQHLTFCKPLKHAKSSKA